MQAANKNKKVKEKGPALMKKGGIGQSKNPFEKKGAKKLMDTDSEFGTDREFDEDFSDDISDARDQSQFSEQDSEVSKFSMG